MLLASINTLYLLQSPWGAHQRDVKPPAGFVTRHTEREDSVAFQGAITGIPTVMVYAFTPFTRKLSEVTLIIGKPLMFMGARTQYQSFKTSLVEMYGKPTHSYEFFMKPYYGGDGKADLALSEGKYNISDFWTKDLHATIGMAMTPEGWTCITYESRTFGKIARDEQLR